MFDFDKLPQRRLPQHGGKLQQAIAEGIHDKADWMDLSTGINPEPWPIPDIPEEAFYRLPEADGQLVNAARDYFFQQIESVVSPGVLPIPGSQWFIQIFPNLIKNIVQKRQLKILLPVTGFAEHEYWWRHYQHSITTYEDNDIQDLFARSNNVDAMVVINPNNPTTCHTPAETIIRSAEKNPDTLFIVDEAFIDSRPAHSLLGFDTPDNIIILRSLGKFFGLAGLRIGFVVAHQALINWLRNELGSWPITTPSQWLATQALQDFRWQEKNRERLRLRSKSLAKLLESVFSESQLKLRTCDYFITLECLSVEKAVELNQAFKNQAVLIRHFENSSLLRIGLPNEHDLDRLTKRLKTMFYIDKKA